MPAPNKSEVPTPPIEPTDEGSPPKDATFATACKNVLKTFPFAHEWKLGKQLVTHSDQWGDVWRADFEIGGSSLEPLVNRIVCWRQADGEIAVMFAIGQSIPSLQ